MPTQSWETAGLKQLALDHLWMPFQPPEPYVGEGGPRLERITPGGVVVDFGTARALIPVQ